MFRYCIILLMLVFTSHLIDAQVDSILVGNEFRYFSVQVPANADLSIEHPIVIVLHGYSDEVESIGEYTGFNKKGQEEGFIAAYPFSKQNDNGFYIWNAGNIYESWTNNSKDTDFIDSLIDFLIDKYSPKSKKVFLCGYSNGAMMAYKLAARLSHKINTVACISAPMVDTASTAKTPVNLIHIHGDADLVVPHIGTEQYGFDMPSIDASLKKWMNWNNCPAVPTILEYNKKHTILEWDGDAKVRFILLHEHGHDWPTEQRGKWPATDNIWRFFTSCN